jgi:hypothetical protein
MLLGFVLVLTQSVGAGTADLAMARSNCRPCGCAARTCCVGKSAPAPVSAPAAPLNSLSSRQHQSMLPPSSLVCAPPVLPASRLSSVFFSLVRLEAVPLYEWNCTFLI